MTVVIKNLLHVLPRWASEERVKKLEKGFIIIIITIYFYDVNSKVIQLFINEFIYS